ncbi:unnamed protein product [Ilex paraguariensis]|uniref:Uncharacterized protein n=1 Tax=Ilex paraguariensis TaxID=185542 RepID=A0ABC8REA2_9AQUA
MATCSLVAESVVGESRRKEEYFCFPEHYCACYSFFYDIVNRGEQLCVSSAFLLMHLLDISMISLRVLNCPLLPPYYCILVQCKHQVAARLAVSVGVCVDVKVSDEELALLLSKL